MISSISRIPFSLWLSAGIIYAAACRPQVPTADDLADLAAIVDEARELAPVARALCGAAGSPECAEVAEVVDKGLDQVAPVLDAVRACADEACKAPHKAKAKEALPKAKRARDTARRLSKRAAPASSASAAPAASGAP